MFKFFSLTAFSEEKEKENASGIVWPFEFLFLLFCVSDEMHVHLVINLSASDKAVNRLNIIHIKCSQNKI